MASTYVNDLRLNELGTGDASGTWGTITNLNLELIGEGLSYGTQDCFTTDANATTTVADGASDPARAMYFKVTSSATLTATRTLTIAPNTVSRLQFIENATTGGQSINISQGSGSNVTIPTGQTKAVSLDGGGATAAVTDAFANLSAGTITASLTGTASNANQLDSLDSTQFLRSDVADTKTSGDLSFSDSVKAVFGAGSDLQIYHDSATGKSHIYEQGTGALVIQGTNIEFDATDGTSLAEFNDAGAVNLRYSGDLKLNTKSDGVLIGGELEATTLDINGAGNISGTLTMGGNIDMQDDDELRIGTGDDLRLYHSSNQSYIDSNGAGNLFIRQKNNDLDVIIESDDSAGGTTTYFQADGSTGEVVLYHYGSSKLKTKSDGISVTGNVQSSSGTFEGSSDQDKIVIGSSQIDFYINNSNEFRMESDGDFHADGDVIAFSTTISDERLKTDIEKIENATDKVSQLNGYTFTYKADGKKSAGVIAQEVEKVLPSAVSEKELPLKMDDGVAYKTVQYDQIIGLLIESVKELKQEINDLRGN
jgi:hypothetical protein